MKIEQRIKELENAQAEYRKAAIIKKHAREFYLALVTIRGLLAEPSSRKIADRILLEAGL